MNDLLPKAGMRIGKIAVQSHLDDGGKPTEYDYAWQGGDIIHIHFELLEKSDPGHVEWDRGIEEVTTGDIIKIGPYTTEVINVDFERDVVICLRMRSKEEAVNDK